MTDFLLELRSEEIPARMQIKAADDLARLFAEEIAKSDLKSSGIETLVTPRRLTLIARGLPVETESVSEERKGPRANAPEQALAGFLRSTGLARDQLVERDGVFFAVIEKPGRPTAAVLAEAIPAIVRAFPWPKSMRWGGASLSTESLKWVRPLQGIVALFGETIVPFEIDGIESGATTLGHRFHHSGPITIGSADDYAEKLRMCHVIVDHAERMAVIRDGATAAASTAGLTMVPDEGLIAENAGLTEWPVSLLGRFDPEFLTVPREVIQLTMRTNQKYFACTDAEGALANAFICTANIDASDGGAGIVAGNQKVLAARLSDAKFFWEQDLKVPLEEQSKKLSQIVFHEKLGTVADKVDRVAKLARWLVEEGIVSGEGDKAKLADMAETAARLSKADLVTGMVGEFPELQGVMGGYYAAAQEHDAQVADAIRDHYGLPLAPVSVAVALADRLDTLGEFFRVDEKPTGSKDPFALRRAGIQSIFFIMRELRLDLAKIVSNDVVEFLIERWKVQNKSAGGRPDLIDAVRAVSGDGDLYLLGLRMRALEEFVTTTEGENLLSGYKRASNILKKEALDPSVVAGSYTPEPAELSLTEALDAAEPLATEAIAREDFEAAMSALATLRAPIDSFFETVTVNDPVPEKRNARLKLLARVRDAVHRVADFSKIEG
jgi:glycyl-tRNA synthetase beta chain